MRTKSEPDRTYKPDKMQFLVRYLKVIFLLKEAITATRIVEHPQDKVLFLSSRDEVVVFACKVEFASYGANWKVNGTTAFNLPGYLISTQTFNGSITNTDLSFPAQSSYNQTTIQCIGYGDEIVQSNEAVLTYQGLLDEPSSIIAIPGLKNITISWSVPFTLDVTDVDPDIWYSVLIYNVTDNLTAIPCTDCINITETHYTFTPDYPSPCHKYTFTVIPLNGAGQGSSANETMGYSHAAPPGVPVDKATITPYKNKIVIKTPLHSSRGTVLCFGELPEYFKLYYESSHEGCPPAVSVVPPEMPPEDSDMWLIEAEVLLGKNCNYTVIVVSHNGAGETNSSGVFSISTRVVDVDVDMVTGGVVVRCGFQDTLSVKCFVQLVSGVHGGHYEGECLEGGREASHVFTGLMPSTYTVLVYGLDSQEPSCLPSARHDYITVITVNNTSTVSTPVTPKPNTSASPPRGSSLPKTSSNNLCIKGVGVGISIGVTATFLVFAVAILIIKVHSRHKKKGLRNKQTGTADVTLEKNAAYELHKPVSCKRRTTQHIKSVDPVYEDIH